MHELETNSKDKYFTDLTVTGWLREPDISTWTTATRLTSFTDSESFTKPTLTTKKGGEMNVIYLSLI